MPTADFSASSHAVTVNLAAGVATAFTGSRGAITTEAGMLAGESGYGVVPLLTVGETLAGTSGALNPSTAGAYTPVGVLDGIGAYALDAATVRVLVSHELGTAAGYTISDGAGGSVPLTGARISYFDIDTATLAIVDGGIAFDLIHNRAGAVVAGAADLEIPGGMRSFCSSVLVEAEAFGAGRGVEDRIYLTGEEASGSAHPHGGSVWALDVKTGELWAVPAFGRGRFENVAQLDTGDSSHVAFLLADDSSGAALMLYVGEKDPAGDFLDRNGLSDGQLYVWKSDTGELSPSAFPTGSLAGSWVPVAAREAGSAGQPGYDAAGYADAASLTAAADAVGAFNFRRLEDVAVNPADGSEAVFATTGIEGSTNQAGTLYTVDVDFADIGNPTATVSVLYNANLDPDRRIRNPDNLDWADDGRIYVQEDRATSGLFGAGAVNPNEASILRLDPATGAIVRVAEIDRAAAGPFGASDNAPGAVAVWESSGILDVSSLFGKAPGSLFLADVQAHSVTDGAIAANDLVQGGQLVAIAAPGADIDPAVTTTAVDGVTRVVGSAHADTVIGDAAANRVLGGKGSDRIDGAGGDDILKGGRGGDLIVGGAGRDLMKGGRGRDVFDFNSLEDMGRSKATRDTIKDFRHKADRLDLSSIDANGNADGDAAFTLVGGRKASFTGAGAELRWYQVDRKGDARDKTMVVGDVDGDGRADFRIELTGLVRLSDVDFVL